MDEEPPTPIVDQLQRLARHSLLLNGLALLTGIVGGLAAVGFRWLLALVNNAAFFQTISIDLIPPGTHALGWLVLLLPALGGLAVGVLTHRYVPEARGTGVPQVMRAMATRGGRLRPRVVFGKTLASALTIGTGGSSGREGPIVQIGSAAGSTLGQLVRLGRSELKVLVGCGAAAGVTATFNTPLAGVVFAIELILLEFRTRSFVPLVVASVVATVISRTLLGPQPAFEIPVYHFEAPLELVFYLVLGGLAAAVGGLFILSLDRAEQLFRRLRTHPAFKPAIGGLLLGPLGLAVPAVFGVGYETVNALLHEQWGAMGLPLMGSLLGLALTKVVAVSLTLGSNGSGGVFAPSLFIGAAVGGAFGVGVNLLFPTVASPYPAYALVGMAAVFAAATRATFTSILMLFEMTRDYEIILPLMFACVVADLLAWRFYRDTIYTRNLRRRGIKIEHDLEVNRLRTRDIGDVMVRDVETVSPDMSLRKVRRRILESGHHGFPVVNENGQLRGIVTGRDVNRAIQTNRHGRDLPVDAVARTDVVVAYPDETLDVAWQRMQWNGIGHLPVVAREDSSRLVGYLVRADLIRGRA